MKQGRNRTNVVENKEEIHSLTDSEQGNNTNKIFVLILHNFYITRSTQMTLLQTVFVYCRASSVINITFFILENYKAKNLWFYQVWRAFLAKRNK